MLLRPCRCRHSISVRRLQAKKEPGRSSTSPFIANCRLLTTRPELRPWRPKTFQSGIGFLPERSLATAIHDCAPLDDSPNPALDALPSTRYGLLNATPPPLDRPPPLSTALPRPLWELRTHNVAAPLVINETTAMPDVRQKINTRGIPGDIDEMLSVLDACLHVGKIERAALVLKRLSRPEFAAAGIDLLELNNQYLQASLEQLIAAPDVAAAEALHKWYELEIRAKRLGQTPETIALMLKASLLTTRGARRKRLVDRYMGMVPGDTGLEVLYMTGILNDQDRAAITDICQTYNLAPKGAETDSSKVADQLDAAVASAVADTTGSMATASHSPEVLGTPQKGMGLRMLKKTLSLFSEIPQGHDIGSLGRIEQREVQARLEKDCVDAAVERWKEENQALLKMGLNTGLANASLNSRLYEWHKDLELRISQELKRIELAEVATTKNKEDLDRCIYGPFLRQSPPSRLAAITIVSTLSSIAMQGADKGVPVGVVVTQVAKVVEEDIRLVRLTHKMATKRRNKNTRSMLRHAAKVAANNALFRPVAEESATEDPSFSSVFEKYREAQWPISIKAKVGAALLSMLIEAAKVTTIKEHPETSTLLSQQQPAFTRLNQLRRGKKIGSLVANPTLVDMLKREPPGDFMARHLPMVAEPDPWTGFDKGGFIAYPTPLVRLKDGGREQKLYTLAAIARGDMTQVLRGLDVLGRTAWHVNRRVFDVMLEAWNSGEALAAIPPLAPDIPMPPEPVSTEDPLARRAWYKAIKTAENLRSGMHSVRCFMNFQMEVARAFRDQTLYFPHNVDFRGRAYPVPPYFNHMGADHVRGLLKFAKGKPLGADGLRWLKVHLSNVFGYDKASLSDRAAFADEHLDQIRDAASNPLHGTRWWLQAEDPWQCLAACMELTEAMKLPDPTTYVSSLPVHQDGTCNGLQHYAALGGDTWGAQQVNLMPGDQPADVYSAVADIVKESIAEDLARGDPYARALDGKIKRKVVKQTVMTNVYGVTFSGARKQVLKQLDALYPRLAAESGIQSTVLASYIATKIFRALSTMFSGAHDIQHWLGEVGGRVCRSLTAEQVERIVGGEPEPATDVTTASGKGKGRGRRAAGTAMATATTSATTLRQANDEILGLFRSTLVWTTPLQMPVVQPYRKSTSRTIETCLQDLILAVPGRADPVHRRKQLQAFPPNFIHSLDASHMLLSALECDALGLSFAAVHDSFWTHAADVSTMNRVLRDAFIRIHSEDVVGRLAAEFATRYRGSMYLAQVAADTAVAKEVLSWRKARRLSLKDELVLEKRRLDLLRSDDTTRVAEGQQMVTPASLFEMVTAKAAANGTGSAVQDCSEAAIEAEDLSEFQLGNIPTARAALSAGGKGKGKRGRKPKAAKASALEDVMAATEHDIPDHDEYIDHNEAEALAELEGSAESDVMADDVDLDADTTIVSLFEAELKRIKRPSSAGTAGSKTVKAGARKPPVQIWMPLTFPPVPAKGDFDVRRLKESAYFFS